MTGIINEEWRSINGYLNYQVSNIGRVRNATTGRILKPAKNHTGYLYVVLSKNTIKKHHLIHRLVACEFIDNPDSKPIVDHINHIQTDNTLNNLRWVSESQNIMNSKKHISATSKYKGVSYYKSYSKWRASISVDRKHKCLGYFANEKEAAASYNKAAVEHFGEYACLNEISDDEF